ncbi:MAG TPA: cation diffusion facilitator family transporter [Candidatus Saccharimonadales bacterium]|nr:cation diffusion facilitator family transporter [Candidatus Saccharimonadales bacterium]
MARESGKVLYAALAGNVAVAVSKFVVAAISGSSSMMAEAVHSSVDTGNEVLLLWGMRQSRVPATAAHPFGHGREVCFWSFVVVIMLFAFGGGLSMYDGVRHIFHPEELEPAFWNYVVLGLSACFEGFSWLVGLRELLCRRRPGRSVWQALEFSKDPSVMSVVFEDSAALLGIGIAALGVWSSHHWQLPRLDGAASVCIGLLLAAVAILFGREVKGLLIGEAADPEVIKAIRQVASCDPDIESAGDPLTMQLAPSQVLLNMELRFRAGLDRDGIERVIDRIEAEIRRRAPEVTRIYIEAESLKPHGDEAPTGVSGATRAA